jgi:transposase InsO family protein
VILRTLTGERTIAEASAELGIHQSRFNVIRREALEAEVELEVFDSQMSEHCPLSDAIETIAAASRRAEAAARQQPRRLKEHEARISAVAMCEALRAAGHSCLQAAWRLNLQPRTLSYWRQQFLANVLQPVLRGRPCHEVAEPVRREIVARIDAEGPHLGMPTLRSLMPDVRRCQLLDLQDRYRAWHCEHLRVVLHRLTWAVPGTVWAIDHSDPPMPVDGGYAAILALRDLASGFQIAWLSVVDQTAEATVAALAPIINYYGAPLVIKSDNGSAFKSDAFARLLSEHEIIHLRSPARTPRYNGSCEAGIGAMKVRTEHFAARAGHISQWRSADLNRAIAQANNIHRSETDPHRSAADRWAERTATTSQQRAELKHLIAAHRAVLIEASAEFESPCNESSITRKAISQALVDLELLSFNRRRIHPPLNSSRLAKIP